MSAPVYVDPFVGAGAVWLHLLDPHLTPPVSWMGGKRRMAAELLHLLGLTPGHPVPCALGDASWWGWVWPICLDPATGPEVGRWLRSWRAEEPRALWFRLRDAGPPDDLVERAAGLLWLQARAASGVPVWWEGHACVQWTATRVDGAGQREATEPGGERAACGKGLNRKGFGGMANPGTIARRLDHIRSRLVKASGGEAGLGYDDGVRRRNGWRAFKPSDVAGRLDAIRAACVASPLVSILHADALTLTDALAPRLGDRARVYLDPPYEGATGYPASCPRSEVLAIADTWARHGARVVLSEAVGLVANLGAGWEQAQLRRGRRPEWVTTWGCVLSARHGPLFAVAP